MKDIKIQIIKKNYCNYKTIVIVISFIILLVLSLKYSVFIYPLVLISIIIIMSFISFTKEIKSIKEIYSYKNGIKQFSYEPLTISTKRLIDAIKTYGLPLSYIKIKNIYALEIVKVNNNYICYLDEKEYDNIEEFLEVIIDGKKLADNKNVKLLSFNNENPKTFNDYNNKEE